MKKRLTLLPLVLVTTLAFTGCSPDFWPDLGAEPTNSAALTPTAAPGGPVIDAPTPVVSVPQLETIVEEISDVATAADASLDADLLSTRFTGAALQLRTANYAIRAALPEYPAPIPVPAGPLTLTLPQDTEVWPRLVVTVIQHADDDTTPPLALILSQASPRDNYEVTYAITLEAEATVPDVAPASVGAAIVAPDTKLLVLPPDQVSAAYADILTQGESSPYYSLFQAEGDTLRDQVGVAAKEARKAALPSTASLEFSTGPGVGPTTALATNDSGAIVAVTLDENELVKPTQTGATVSPEGAAKALSGVTASTKGIQSTYSDQLLFYVPAMGSNAQIVLLGFSQGLTASSEVQ